MTLRRGAAALVGQLSNRAFALLLMLACARSLGPDDFSSYALFANLALFAAAFALPGLDVDVIRTRGREVGRVLSAKLFACLVAGIGLVAVARFALDYPWILIAFAVASGYAQGLAETPESVLVVQDRISARAIIQAAPSFTALVAVISADQLDWAKLLPVMAIVAGRDLVRLTLGFAVSKPDVGKVRPSVPSRDLVNLAGITILSYLYFRVDILLLGASSHSSEVGIYAAAYTIVVALQNIPNALGPLLLKRFSSGAGGARRVVILQWLAGCGAGLATIALSGPIVDLALGPQYLASTSFLRILALSVPPLFLNGALFRYLLSRNEDRLVFRSLAVVSVASVPGTAAAIAQWGAHGAAWASVVVEILLSVMFCAHAWRVSTSSMPTVDDDTQVSAQDRSGR